MDMTATDSADAFHPDAVQYDIHGQVVYDPSTTEHRPVAITAPTPGKRKGTMEDLIPEAPPPIRPQPPHHPAQGIQGLAGYPPPHQPFVPMFQMMQPPFPMYPPPPQNAMMMGGPPRDMCR